MEPACIPDGGPPLGEDPLRPGLVGCWGRKAAVCSGAGGVEGSKSRIKEQLLGPGGWAGGAALLFAFCVCGSLHSPSPADILSRAGGQHWGRGPGLRPREQVQGCGSLPWEALTGVPMHLLGQALHGHLPPRALGHLSTAHPRGSGPRQLQVTSLVLAEASPLSTGSYRSPGSRGVWVGVGTVTQRQLLHPRGPRNTGHSDL